MSDTLKGGETIRELRLKKNLTIKQLGELVNTHYVFLSRLERNLEKPSEDLIRRIAKVLDYEGNIDELVMKFGKIPEHFQKMILDDPYSAVALPEYFKSRKKGVNRYDK